MTSLPTTYMRLIAYAQLLLDRRTVKVTPKIPVRFALFAFREVLSGRRTYASENLETVLFRLVHRAVSEAYPTPPELPHSNLSKRWHRV